MLIRRAKLADLELIAPLFDLYRQFYKQPPDLGVALQFLADRLKADESVIFVAIEESGQLHRGVGFVQLYPLFSSTLAKPMWLLNDLYVTNGFRGTGVGRGLMDAAREHAESTGACTIELATAHTNEKARRLYEGLGYKRDVVYVRYELEV